MSTFSDAETRIMQRVLDLAAKGCATTQPNPRVGCVLVNNGEIVGEGFHHSAGDLHAERDALKHAGGRARGATAYVNLEPCCHQGRTPPCTDGLIDAGVSKVVAAIRDPNPLVAGGGFETLKMAGIEVAHGLLEQEAAWLNRGFITRMREQRPWVKLKTAATLDGRTAAYDGTSQWITNPSARQKVQSIRANSSAVVTGIGTVLADDPQMSVRLENTTRQPLRVLLDTKLRIPQDARLIGDGDGVLIFTASEDQQKIAEFTEMGVEVVSAEMSDTGQINLDALMQELASWECNDILVEAGKTLSGAFIEANLVDELIVFYGNSLLGDQAMPMFEMGTPIEFQQRPEFVLQAVEHIENNVCITAVSNISYERLR